MYDSAFNRAPEFNGLKYWANKLSAELSWGTDQATAYTVISKQMYIDGKGNNEGGTSLGNADYVNYAYQNILGRNGEAAGVTYWNNQLATGAVDRGGFVAKFVGDALGNVGDGDFQARIAVSKFAGPEHVSRGPSAPGIDLHGVIQNVYDATSANAAINAIIQKYGTAAVPHALDAMLTSWADPASSDAVHTDASVTAIELTGVAAQAQDVFLCGLVARSNEQKRPAYAGLFLIGESAEFGENRTLKPAAPNRPQRQRFPALRGSKGASPWHVDWLRKRRSSFFVNNR